MEGAGRLLWRAFVVGCVFGICSVGTMGHMGPEPPMHQGNGNCNQDDPETDVCSFMEEYRYPCIIRMCCSDMHGGEEMMLEDSGPETEVEDETRGRRCNDAEDDDTSEEDDARWRGRHGICHVKSWCTTCKRRCCEGYVRGVDGRCHKELVCQNGVHMHVFDFCVCKPNFEGKECETPVCNCINRGRCIVKDGKPTCECPDNYFGNRCQFYRPKTTPAPTPRPTTKAPVTKRPTTQAPTRAPTTRAPTTIRPPTTRVPTTTRRPTTLAPTTTRRPTTLAPTTTRRPTTLAPTTTRRPTTLAPTTTRAPTTRAPTTRAPTTRTPTTRASTTRAPLTTRRPTTRAPTTRAPTTRAPTKRVPTTRAPTTRAPTTRAPTTRAPITRANVTTRRPTTQAQTPMPAVITCPQYTVHLPAVDRWTTVQLDQGNTGVKARDSNRHNIPVTFIPDGLAAYQIEATVTAYAKGLNGRLVSCELKVVVTVSDTGAENTQGGLAGQTGSAAERTGENEEDLVKYGLILGPVIGGLVILAIIVGALCCLKKRRGAQNLGAMKKKGAIPKVYKTKDAHRAHKSKAAVHKKYAPPTMMQGYDNHIYNLPYPGKFPSPPPSYSARSGPPSYIGTRAMKECEYVYLTPPTYAESIYGKAPSYVSSGYDSIRTVNTIRSSSGSSRKSSSFT